MFQHYFLGGLILFIFEENMISIKFLKDIKLTVNIQWLEGNTIDSMTHTRTCIFPGQNMPFLSLE